MRLIAAVIDLPHLCGLTTKDYSSSVGLARLGPTPELLWYRQFRLPNCLAYSQSVLVLVPSFMSGFALNISISFMVIMTHCCRCVLLP